LIPPETDLIPFDQLEKCRKPDYRHLGGGSRRCDEMSFLFHTSGSVGDLGGQPPRSTRPATRGGRSPRARSPGRSSSVGSRRGTWLARCRSSKIASYTHLRQRLIPPSGRCVSRACQGVKERFSSNSRTAGVSNCWTGIRSVATFVGGDFASSHTMVASSTGIASGSVCTWTRKSNHASWRPRWAASASRSRSFESRGTADGKGYGTGRTEYFTASRSSL